jgi:hypothetical protein
MYLLAALGSIGLHCRHVGRPLDGERAQNSGRLRCAATNVASLLDKPELFHKIFMSRRN